MNAVCPAVVWADVFGKEVYRKRIAQVQRRGALRVKSAYRIASELAVMVIAGVIRAVLLAREERQRTLNEWQLSWQNETTGTTGSKSEAWSD